MGKRKCTNKRSLYIKALAGRASVYKMVGEYEKGMNDCRKALAHAEAATERAEALIDLASFMCRKGHDYAKAKQLMREAAEVIDERRNPETYVQLLNHLGLIGIYEGTYDEARSVYLKMLHICRKRGLVRRIQTAFFNMATLCHSRGELKDARRYYHESLTHARKLNDLLRIGNTYSNLAILNRDRGDFKKALEYIGKCRTIYEKIGDKKGFAGASSIHGTIHFFRAEFSEALHCYELHLAISEEVGDEMGISIGCNNVGIVHALQADLDTALKYYKRSLAIAEKIGYPRGICINCGNIGKVFDDRGDLRSALRYYDRLHKLASQIGQKRAIGQSQVGRGRIFRKKGQLRESMEALQIAERIFGELDDRIGSSETFTELALVHAAMKEGERAVEFGQRALEISRTIGAKREEICALRALGVAFEGADAKSALSYHERSVSLARKEKVQLELARSILAYVAFASSTEGFTRSSGSLRGLLEEAEEILERAGATRRVSQLFCGREF